MTQNNFTKLRIFKISQLKNGQENIPLKFLSRFEKFPVRHYSDGLIRGRSCSSDGVFGHNSRPTYTVNPVSVELPAVAITTVAINTTTKVMISHALSLRQTKAQES